jgi:hypothetical protein
MLGSFLLPAPTLVLILNDRFCGDELHRKKKRMLTRTVG